MLKTRGWLILLFGFLFVHASLLGLSDDEAYYWVLAQKPALGYAFHPPAVAWMIAAFEKALGWLVGNHSVGLVRLPAILTTVLLLVLGLKWVESAARGRGENAGESAAGNVVGDVVGDVGRSTDGKERGRPVNQNRALVVLLSFFGFFSLSWMMVPDIPLFLSWTVLFVLTWEICSGQETCQENFQEHHKTRGVIYAGIVLASAGLLLSKFSGVLGIFSAFLCLVFWAPSNAKCWGCGALGLGAILGVTPTLIWNWNHEWGSILYQLHDRHAGGEVSWLRYLRFWAAELILAGPILIGFGGWLSWKVLRHTGFGRAFTYVVVWAVPAAAVFCLQPLFSDFKLHWAFIVWWPFALGLALKATDLRISGPSGTTRTSEAWGWIRYQGVYGISLGALILLSCHLPVGNWILRHFKGEGFDPRLDVTNDFYGWKELRSFLDTQMQDSSSLPVVGSRYQTASQLAFYLGPKNPVTLLPRDLKERDEWPNLEAVDGWGPQWPKLRSPVLFVADNRYSAPPEFQEAVCKKAPQMSARRSDVVVKWFDVWRCDPVR